jgi:hypothetical protein
MKQALITAVCLAAASTWAAAQNPKPNPPSGQTGAQTLKLIGCLQPAQANNSAFQLIVPGEKSPGSTAEPSVTTTYVLTAANAVDLKSHLNEMVEVTGTELPAPAASATVVDSTRGQTASQPTGTSGRSNDSKGAKTTPTVETTTKAQIVAKAMTVDSVKTVATKCDLDK